jgi:hypothetical protein
VQGVQRVTVRRREPGSPLRQKPEPEAAARVSSIDELLLWGAKRGLGVTRVIEPPKPKRTKRSDPEAETWDPTAFQREVF